MSVAISVEESCLRGHSVTGDSSEPKVVTPTELPCRCLVSSSAFLPRKFHAADRESLGRRCPATFGLAKDRRSCELGPVAFCGFEVKLLRTRVNL